MQISKNTSPFPADLFVHTDKDGRKHCVVVIKATFDVSEGGDCRPADEQQPLMYVDEHYGDPAQTSTKYESDFVPTKPRADVLVTASAYAPAGRAVTMLEVRLVGAGIEKRALVTGDRHWERGGLGIQASKPKPFDRVPLVWERAFGGSDGSHKDHAKHGSEVRNLVGVGFHLNGDADTIVGKPLPNIERSNSQIGSWSDKPEPIGFGPTGRGWQPRIAFGGTYDQRWMDERLPFLPADFDDRYFQSASLDQQVARLSPGQAFGCLNMNVEGRFAVHLPPLDVPVRFAFDDRAESAAVMPDTLILEPDRWRIQLIGRATIALRRKLTSLREIQVGRSSVGKPHFSNLDEAIRALRGPR